MKGIKKKTYNERKREWGERAVKKGIEKEKRDRKFGYSDKKGSINPMGDNKDRLNVKDLVKYAHEGIADMERKVFDARKRSKKSYQ